jgi:hypothetical protein
MGTMSILFGQTSNLYLRSLCILLLSIGSSFVDVNINLAAIACFKGDNLSTWLQGIHGGFSIGGLLGPIVVYLSELSALTVLGIWLLIYPFFYYFLESPENNRK